MLVVEDDDNISHMLKFMLERADGSVIPHKLLSYGQKRALAFLYYLELFERTPQGYQETSLEVVKFVPLLQGVM